MAKDDKTADLFEDDGVTPKSADKPVITKEVLEASERAARAEGESAALKEALKAKPPAPKPQAEKEVTRAELRAKVNAGELTEDQMDDILDRQAEKRFERRANEIADSKIATRDATNKVSDQIARYVQAFPDINKEGSDLRAKVEAEFQDLLRNKSPDTDATELAAIKIVCGQLKTGAGRRAEPDSHEDVGTGGGDGGKPDTSGWAKGLAPKIKKHYDTLVLKGVYKSYSDPRLLAELKYARGRTN